MSHFYRGTIENGMLHLEGQGIESAVEPFSLKEVAANVGFVEQEHRSERVSIIMDHFGRENRISELSVRDIRIEDLTIPGLQEIETIQVVMPIVDEDLIDIDQLPDTERLLIEARQEERFGEALAAPGCEEFKLRTLLNPAVVARVEDRGVYRAVYLTNKFHRFNKQPLHTRLSLEQLIAQGLAGGRADGPA